MGRIFEKRKHKIFARNAKISKTFSRIGKEITLAVKAGGPNPDANVRLRAAINNARGANMPKDKIEAAIRRAVARDQDQLEEITYEGYAPGGVALMIDCVTDNPTRTVANLRMHFSKGNGSLASSGSVAFFFERKGLFKLRKEDIPLDTWELELIDMGADEIIEEEDAVYIYTRFADFGSMQKGLEAKNILPISSEKPWVPLTTMEVTDAIQQQVWRLIDMLEDDDDVQAVYHNMA